MGVLTKKNVTGYQPIYTNPYAIPVAAVGAILITLGIVVLGREKGSVTGWLFLGLTLTVGAYLIAAATSYASQNAAYSLLWARAAHVGVGLMPSAIAWAAISILGQLRRRIGWLIGIAIWSGFFGGLAVFSDWFVNGNRLVFWGYYPTYGTAGLLFIVFFAAVMIGVIVIYARELRQVTNPTRRSRLTGMIIAFACGYLGAVDFLPVIGLEIYAFGYIPIFVFILIVAYVVLKYRLVDITPAVAAPQILQTMQSGVIVIDTAGTVRVANPVAEALVGTGSERLIGRSLNKLLKLPDGWFRSRDPREPIVDYELELPGKGSMQVLSVSASPLVDRGKTLLGQVFVAHDITDRKAAEASLRTMALYDSLTELPNRVLFLDRLEYLLKTAERNQYSLAVLYMDLDKFKAVNDNWGHGAGDELLKQVAKRMKDAVRASDTVARMGGDEFIAVCAQVGKAANAEIVAQKLVDAISEPFDLGDHVAHIGVSIGISVCPDHGKNGETLLAQADRAMYRAKKDQETQFCIFNPDLE